MKKFSTLSALLVLLVGLTAAMRPAHASHFRYGSVTWTPTGIKGQVEFRVSTAYRRSYFFGEGTAPDGGLQTGDVFSADFLDFGDGDFASGFQYRVVAYSIDEDYIIGEGFDSLTNGPVQHTYAGAGPFTANVSSCCRLSTSSFSGDPDAFLNNRGDADYQLTTVVTPQNGNSSPVATFLPILTVPHKTNASFQLPVTDPDGDALRFRFATNEEAVGTFAAGDINNPPNMTIDPVTGKVTWDNSTLNLAGFWTTQIMISDIDANGVEKSRVPVDFLMKITNATGSAPFCTITPPGPFGVAPGTPVTFTVQGFDPDGTKVTLNTTGLPPGATINPALPLSGSSGVSARFNWTPGPTQTGRFVVLFSIKDASGLQGLCPITLTIDVLPPTIRFTSPDDNITLNTTVLPAITGIATDNPGGSGIDHVSFFLRNPSGQYWNGSTYVAAKTGLGTFRTATTWEYTGAKPTGANLSDGIYTLQATAFDRAGNNASAVIHTLVNTTAPVVHLITPPKNAVLTSLPAISGTASDGGSGVNRLTLTIRRNSDGKFWNGSSFIAAVFYLLPDIAGTTFSYGAVPSGLNLPNGTYTLTANAFDRAGRRATDITTVTVAARPLTVSITAPSNGATLKSLPPITGTASGGSGVSRVNVAIRRFDSRYWNGAAWVTTFTTLPATLSGGTFTFGSNLPSGVNLPNGAYSLTAYATDTGGHKATASVSVNVNSSATGGGGGTGTTTYSSGSATASNSNVRLGFTGALNSAEAITASHYTVKVNGVTKTISSVFYSTSTHTVILVLPAGTLRAGNSVVVTFSNLKDANGLTVSGQTNAIIVS